MGETAGTCHSATTLLRAAQESAEHMEGMDVVYNEMRKRPLRIKAYAVDTPAVVVVGGGSHHPCKTVHFVRHGQGFHNFLADQYTEMGKEWIQFSTTTTTTTTSSDNNPYTKPELLDPPLTEKGRQQALALQGKVMKLSHPPELILLSPLCRALQTGLIVFEKLRGKSQFLAMEWLREETGVHICDRRRPVSQQVAEFPQVNFSLLTSEQDPLFSETQRESKLQLGERIYQFLEWLSQRPEQHVAVSSHSCWLLTLFNGILECDDSLKTWFQTGEMRSVILEFVEQ